MLFYYQKQKLNMYTKTNKIEWNPSMAFIVANDKIPIQHVWVAPLLFSFGKHLQHSWSKYNANQTGRKSLDTSLIADFMNFSYWRDICSIKKMVYFFKAIWVNIRNLTLKEWKSQCPATINVLHALLESEDSHNRRD